MSVRVPLPPLQTVQSCPPRRAGVARDERTTDAVDNSCQMLRTAVNRPQIVRKNRISYPQANQPTLLHAITTLAEQQPPGERHHEDQLGQRNRIEARYTSVWPVAAGSVGAE